MRTPLCELLGIEVPVVLAPMGGAVTPALAGAVSSAGGLGMLPLTWTPPEQITAVVEKTRNLTERPFGVNLGLAWDQRERLASAMSAGVRVVSFFWGDAGGLIAQVRAAGAIVCVTVGTAAEARAAVDAGAEIIVAQGWEAGGHVWGTVSTLALVPRVVDAVAPVPVVAAGGIADGRALAAVLALGAAGAWVGTLFLAASEAAVHPDYRRRILAAGARSATRQWKPGSAQADPRLDRGREKRMSPPHAPMGRRSTATHQQHQPQRFPATSSRFRTGPAKEWGSSPGSKSAADIVHSLVSEAEAVLESLQARGRSE